MDSIKQSDRTVKLSLYDIDSMKQSDNTIRFS